jgi:hypothetical protein
MCRAGVWHSRCSLRFLTILQPGELGDDVAAVRALHFHSWLCRIMCGAGFRHSRRLFSHHLAILQLGELIGAVSYVKGCCRTCTAGSLGRTCRAAAWRSRCSLRFLTTRHPGELGDHVVAVRPATPPQLVVSGARAGRECSAAAVLCVS